MTLTVDLSPKVKRDKLIYERIRRAEIQYGIKLRKIARHIGEVVKAFPPGDPRSLPEIRRILYGYAELLRPWAKATAAAMLADVMKRDEAAWKQQTKHMSQALRLELNTAPMGHTFRRLQEEQVTLITSLPLEASQRVHRLTEEGLSSGARASEVAKEIMRTGEVTESRATLIARTEVGRASTNFSQARAEFVGSEGYIWRTAHDGDVRPSHKRMEGKHVKWDAPPTLDDMTGHAGTLPNCRCYVEIVLPDGNEI